MPPSQQSKTQRNRNLVCIFVPFPKSRTCDHASSTKDSSTKASSCRGLTTLPLRPQAPQPAAPEGAFKTRNRFLNPFTTVAYVAEQEVFGGGFVVDCAAAAAGGGGRGGLGGACGGDAYACE